MFTFSHNTKNNTISGTINAEVFGVNYSKEVYDAMVDLESKLDQATTPIEAKEITEAFKALTEITSSTTQSNIHPDIFVANTGKYYLMVGGKATSVAMPEALVDRIKDSLDKGLDISPLTKFWIRFLRNHKLRNICDGQEEREQFANRVFNYVDLDFVNWEKAGELMDKHGFTEELAVEMSTVKQVKISKEGLLQTFKVSRELTKRYRLNDKGEREAFDVYEPKVIGVDPITGLYIYADKTEMENEQRVFEPAVMGTGGDEFFCGDVKGHVIRVGQIHKLESWKNINTNDYTSCVPGLHIGGLDYIKGYQNSGTETHNVLVDPAHIGAVPDDSTGAIRCTQYFVLDAFSGVNGSIYHSSAYGKLTDDQWAEEKAQILKEFGELQQKKSDDLMGSLV